MASIPTMSHKDYTVGWICPLPIEMAAARAMLDEHHKPLPQNPRDDNTYTLGLMGRHNVVLACLPTGLTGTLSAARVANQMLQTFEGIRFGLMVGIGGGVPSQENDIRLGDVVVSMPSGQSGGVIQYDFGKTVQEGRFKRTGSLNRPPNVLLTALSNLRSKHMIEGSELVRHLLEMLSRYPKMATQFARPSTQHDSLFDADYDHITEHSTCSQCDKGRLVDREPRTSEDPFIHYGLIASGDQVMRHGASRERLGKELGVLCFEMEAAGLMDDFPCLVVRGICDYADSHKNKVWQGYAAAMAAAYAKELLSVIPENLVASTRTAVKAIEVYRGSELERSSCKPEENPMVKPSAPPPTNLPSPLELKPQGDSFPKDSKLTDALAGALTTAAARGDLQMVLLLLHSVSNINARDNNGGTALHAATFWGHESVVDLLLEKGADPNFPADQFNPLMSAIDRGNSSIVLQLLNAGARANTSGALQFAAAKGNITAIKHLLNAKADINALDGNQCTGLHSASFWGKEDAAKLLLDSGADSTVGHSPLMAAIERGHHNIVRELMSRGAIPK